MSKIPKNLIDFSLDTGQPVPEEEDKISKARDRIIRNMVKAVMICETECSDEEAGRVNYQELHRDGSNFIIIEDSDKKIGIVSLSGEDFTISSCRVLKNGEKDLDLLAARFNAIIAEMGNEIN